MVPNWHQGNIYIPYGFKKYLKKIKQLSKQLSCRGICKLWMWFKRLMNTFVRSQISLTQEVTNGALVTWRGPISVFLSNPNGKNKIRFAIIPFVAMDRKNVKCLHMLLQHYRHCIGYNGLWFLFVSKRNVHETLTTRKKAVSEMGSRLLYRATLPEHRDIRAVSHHFNNVITDAMASQITSISIACSTVCSGSN